MESYETEPVLRAGQDGAEETSIVQMRKDFWEKKKKKKHDGH